MKNKQISILLREDQRKRLEEIQKKKDRSLGYLVREAVDFYFKFHAGKQ